MLTWINEKAKWVIVIFAAGIAVGLLAMDRVPNQAHSYPVGEVNDHKITYAEFDSRVKMIVENQFRDAHPNDEQYTQIRNEVFHGLVRQILLQKEYGKADLRASVGCCPRPSGAGSPAAPLFHPASGDFPGRRQPARPGLHCHPPELPHGLDLQQGRLRCLARYS